MNMLQYLVSADVGERLGWTLVHSVWQGAAAAGLFAGALVLIPKTRPNGRYVAGCLLLAALFVASGITFALIDVSRPTPSAATVAAAEGTSALPVHTATGDAVRAPAGLTPVAVVTPPDPAPVDVSPRTEALRTADTARDAAMTPSAAPVRPWHERAGVFARPYLPWLVLTWMLGVLALSVWRVGGWIATCRLRIIGTTPVGHEIAALAQRLTDRMRLSRPVRVFRSIVIETPAVIGHLRPVVLLPIGALTGLTPDQLEAILAHELAHVRRCDYLARILQTVIETVLFYHPAVWWISRRIDQEREHCCDDWAVATCGSRLGYAKALTELAELRSTAPSLAAAASGGSLLRRIRRLLDVSASGPGPARRALTGVYALAVVLALGVGVGMHALAMNGRDGETAQRRATTPDESRDKAADPPTILRGTVLTPSGRPAVGAQVVRLVPEHEVVFANGKLERAASARNLKPLEHALVTTDAEGRFEFPPGVDAVAIAVVHAEGYTDTSIDGVGKGPITLRAWGNIDGTITGRGTPGESLLPVVSRTWAAYDDNGTRQAGSSMQFARIEFTNAAKPDANGRFRIDRVAAGPCFVWPDVPYVGPGGGFLANIKPGRATTVRMSMARDVTGRLVATPGLAVPITPESTGLVVFLDPPPFSGDMEGINASYHVYNDFLTSETGRAYSQSIRVAADGSFVLRGLPPARYCMQIRTEKVTDDGKGRTLVGWTVHKFDVPAGDAQLEPTIELGAIEVLQHPWPDGVQRFDWKWGDPVDGVRCGLRAPKDTWPVGETPMLVFDLINGGDRQLRVAQAAAVGEVEVDGRWYRWAKDVEVKDSSFPPRRHYRAISLPLAPDAWQAKEGGAALTWSPGRHTIRFAIVASPSDGDTGKPVRVVSNAVDIQIGAATTAPTTAPAPSSGPSRATAR